VKDEQRAILRMRVKSKKKGTSEGMSDIDKLLINKLKLNKKCKSLLLVTDMAIRR
jgi:hypothetical protein